MVGEGWNQGWSRLKQGWIKVGAGLEPGLEQQGWVIKLLFLAINIHIVLRFLQFRVDKKQVKSANKPEIFIIWMNSVTTSNFYWEFATSLFQCNKKFYLKFCSL